MTTNRFNTPKFGAEEYIREQKVNALKRIQNESDLDTFTREIQEFQCPLKSMILKLVDMVKEVQNK